MLEALQEDGVELGPSETRRLEGFFSNVFHTVPLLSGNGVRQLLQQSGYAGSCVPPTQITPSFCGRTLWQVGTQGFVPKHLHIFGVTRTAIRNAREAGTSRKAESLVSFWMEAIR